FADGAMAGEARRTATVLLAARRRSDAPLPDRRRGPRPGQRCPGPHRHHGAGHLRTPPRQAPRWPGARDLRSTFAIDALACPHCAGRLRLLAGITERATAAKILEHLGLSAEGDVPPAVKQDLGHPRRYVGPVAVDAAPSLLTGCLDEDCARPVVPW